MSHYLYIIIIDFFRLHDNAFTYTHVMKNPHNRVRELIKIAGDWFEYEKAKKYTSHYVIHKRVG